MGEIAAKEIIPINLEKNEQFSKEFSLISPSNKVPAIIDQKIKKNISKTYIFISH